jgi:hypothetical protein
MQEALGGRSQRVGANPAGYRHGKRPRTLNTGLGATTVMMPRARIDDEGGRRRESAFDNADWPTLISNFGPPLMFDCPFF